MSAPDPFPARARRLALRGRIRPVARINRKVLIAAAALAVFGLLAAFSVALDPPKIARAGAPDETVSRAGGPAPEGLSRLPASYADLSAPRLGAPMSGDLGGTIIAEERALGLEPDW